MDIIPDLLGETEFKYMNEEDFDSLNRILNDTLSNYLKNYTELEDADPEVVDKIKRYSWPIIDSMTFHLVLRDMGIVDLVRNLLPDSLIYGSQNTDNVYNKLVFLDENIDKLRAVIPARHKEDFGAFVRMIDSVIGRITSAGEIPTYPDILDRIRSNSFMFYQPNAKDRPTGCNVIYTRERIWRLCLNGIKFDRYCKERGINYQQRRVF